MTCQKCKRELDDAFAFCPYCGAKIPTDKPTRKTKSRGNGQGTVYKSGDKYVAMVTLGYYLDENGKQKRKTRSKYFVKKKDAVAALPELKKQIKQIDYSVKFKDLYDEFITAHEEKGTSKSTLDCYRSAVKYFEPLYFSKFEDLVTEHYQKCVDNCPHGKRTRENMKVLVGLLYKQAGRRGMSLTDFSKYIFIKKDESPKERDAFTEDELQILKDNLDTVPFVRYIYTLCYTGYRVNEFLSRKKSDLCKIIVKKKTIYYITGGNKTTAGKNKIVTISPKIKDTVLGFADNCPDDSGYLFGRNGNAYPIKTFRSDFADTLKQLNIRTELTPHCCRHTFATLMKNINAADKDKAALIGHSNIEMTEYYQHTHIEDLAKITNKI